MKVMVPTFLYQHFKLFFYEGSLFASSVTVDIANQLSSNDAVGPLANEANLTIKAAVGLMAFGETSGDGGYSRVGEQHANISFRQGLGTDKDQTHLIVEHPDWPDTWRIPYDLFPDVLLGLKTFSDAAYQIGSNFSTSARGEYGSIIVRTGLNQIEICGWLAYLRRAPGTSSSITCGYS
jgi:hypothetical protein